MAERKRRANTAFPRKNIKLKEKESVEAIGEYNAKLVEEKIKNEMELHELKEEIKDLTEKLQLAEQQNAIFKDDFQRERQDKETAQAELRALKDEQGHVRDEYKKENTTLKRELQNKELELREIKEKLAVSQEELIGLQNSKKSLLKPYEQEHRLVDRLKEEVDGFNLSYNASREDQRERISTAYSHHPPLLHTQFYPSYSRSQYTTTGQEDEYFTLAQDTPAMNEEEIRKKFGKHRSSNKDNDDTHFSQEQDYHKKHLNSGLDIAECHSYHEHTRMHVEPIMNEQDMRELYGGTEKSGGQTQNY